MLVWNDLEADEKVKVYDKGVNITNREGVYNLLVSYRSGDMWAPQLEQVEALRQSWPISWIAFTNGKTPFNDGCAGLRVVQDAGGGDRIADASGERWSTYERLIDCIAPGRETGQRSQAVEIHQPVRLRNRRRNQDRRVRRDPEECQRRRRCKISSHTFICEGVTIEDNVFIGHGVTFINDSYPRATHPGGELQTEKRLESRTNRDQEEARRSARAPRFWPR